MLNTIQTVSINNNNVVPKIYLINSNLARWMKEKVITYNQELCASLKPSQSNPSILVVVAESITLGAVLDPNVRSLRGVCKYKHYSDILLHTHPLFSEAYPTTNDIMDTIKNHNKVQVTIIATRWGIWVIHNKYHRPNVYTTTNDSQLREVISSQLNSIDVATRNGQGGSRDLTPPDLQIIAQSISIIDKTINISIDLYLWQDLAKEGAKIPIRLYDFIPSRPIY